jgi:hypothetical protein
MLKRFSRSERLYRWRITRIRASPTALIGYVEAQHQEQAIQTAIREYGITNPPHQKAAGWCSERTRAKLCHMERSLGNIKVRL